MGLAVIHEDERGSISVLEGVGTIPEITLFKTNAGFARGGCIHNLSNEYCCLLEGRVLYKVGTIEKVMATGDSIAIPKGTPHYFVSLSDSLMVEWGAMPEEKKEKHLETRKIVDNINRTKHDSNTPV